MIEEEAVYKSFLIRIRCNPINQVQQVMVARVHDNDERHYFATLDDVMIFLLHELNNPPKEYKH